MPDYMILSDTAKNLEMPRLPDCIIHLSYYFTLHRVNCNSVPVPGE